MATVQEALQIAVAHHREGRLDQAEAIYRAVLQVDPDNADALHLSGVVATARGDLDRAVALLGRAVERAPALVDAHMNLGRALRQQRRFGDAAASFGRAAALRPDLAQAPFLQGIALREQGRLHDALAVQQRLVAARPDMVEAVNELGMLNQFLGRLDQAVRWYRRVAELRPDVPEAYTNIGAIAHAQRRSAEAERLFRRAVRMAPASSGNRKNLGVVLDALGRPEAACAQFRAAVALAPELADHYRDLGSNLYGAARLDEAVGVLRRALRLRPAFAEALGMLGQVQHGRGQVNEAFASFQGALAVEPDNGTALNGLGSLLLARGRLVEAARALRNAIAVNPAFVEAYNNLAGVWRNQAQQDEAIACYRRSLRLAPANAKVHSNMLLTMCYHDAIDRPTLLQAHLEFARIWETPWLGRRRSWPNDRDPDRRLRIGYVSPDLRDHAAAYFVEPLLAHHDHARVHVTCYSEVAYPDAMTRLLKGHADHWVDTVPLSDDALEARIRADAIDVLVDVAGHTGGNRLPVFARKPAPVQVTWLGYGATTGLAAMDYLLIDPYAIPTDDERFYTETIWRLPRVYRCFKWFNPTPEVGPPPMAARGYPLFGSFNAFVKITPACLAAWAEILRRVPDSRLLIMGNAEPDMVHAAFARFGIGPERLEIVRRQPMFDYLRTITGVDIALDPFPHTGGTTTFQTLWMGAPLVTRAGDRFAARASTAVLAELGLSELICGDTDAYVETAVRLARSPERLASLRAGLRGRMQDSAFMDFRGFAATMEDAYRRMWRKWLSEG